MDAPKASHAKDSTRAIARRDSTLIAQLAPLHAAALRLARRGARPATIAARLGVPEESVPALLEVAAAKLARLEGDRR